jgi:hypothetical protein
MKRINIFAALLTLIFISTNAVALTVLPEFDRSQNKMILTGCPFKLRQALWYDVCFTPATGYNVYYNISRIRIDPQLMLYPPEQKLDYISTSENKAIYERVVWVEYPWEWLSDNPPSAYPLHAFWRYGGYRASTKSTDTYYLTYDKKDFDIYPDFPFFYSFLLSGSPAYLNIKWNGSYNLTAVGLTSIGSCVPDRDISLECVFNGMFISEINSSVRYKPKKEFISTVFSPAYNYFNDSNKICPPTENPPCSSYASPEDVFACRSFDSDHPWLEYLNVINFTPIHFSASKTYPSNVTLGQEFPIKIDVTNHGLFVDNYTIEVISLNPSVISVTHGNGKIENLAANCPKITYPQIPPIDYKCSPTSASFEARALPLTAGSTKLIIRVRSEISNITLVLPEIEIKSGVKSLSEFDILGILQIMIFAAIILIFWKKLC